MKTSVVFRAVVAHAMIMASTSAETYSVTRIDSLLGVKGYLQPTAINNAGSILCQFQPSLTSPSRATLFRNKQTGNVDLGTLGGTNSGPYDLNALNVAVGFAENKNGITRAVVFSPNGLTIDELGTLDNSDPSLTSVATSINDDGVVVGQAYSSPFIYRATRFGSKAAGNFDLGTLGGATSAAACINAAGIIVGTAQTSDGAVRATRFSGKGSGNTDLGTLGGVTSRATSINASGVIVGSADTADFKIHATRWDNDLPRDLGTLGGKNSSATSINVSGDIVGYADSPNGSRAFIIHGFGKMIDLNTRISPGSNVVLMSARDINRAGQILATGVDRGRASAFLLTPKPSITIKANSAPANRGYASGFGTYAKGDTVKLTAIARPGWTFDNWTDGKKVVSQKKTFSFPANKSRKLTANFKPAGKV